MKTIYMSDDGEQFDTPEECAEHEKELDQQHQLLIKCITDKCPRTYNALINASIIDENDVAHFIERNLPEIRKIVLNL